MRTRIRLWGNIYEYASAVYTRQHRGVIKCDHLFGHTLLVAYMVTNLLTDNKKTAAEKRRVYSEVVSGASGFVLTGLLMYLSSVAGVGHVHTSSPPLFNDAKHQLNHLEKT